MLYTLNPALAKNLYIRTLGIFGFAVLTAISAKITILREPVPITMQVLVVLLAGLTLGPRDGALSILAYVAGIAAGLPLDARGLGAAAFSTPTGGYLLAFPIAAWITGMLAIRDHVIVRWLAGMVAVVVIYLIAAGYWGIFLDGAWETIWLKGVKPFILIDLAKALIAAACGEGARQWWLRQLRV